MALKLSPRLAGTLSELYTKPPVPITEIDAVILQRLRQQVKGRITIKTRRGLGYYLEDEDRAVIERASGRQEQRGMPKACLFPVELLRRMEKWHDALKAEIREEPDGPMSDKLKAEWEEIAEEWKSLVEVEITEDEEARLLDGMSLGRYE